MNSINLTDGGETSKEIVTNIEKQFWENRVKISKWTCSSGAGGKRISFGIFVVPTDEVNGGGARTVSQLTKHRLTVYFGRVRISDWVLCVFTPGCAQTIGSFPTGVFASPAVKSTSGKKTTQKTLARGGKNGILGKGENEGKAETPSLPPDKNI